MSSQATRQQKVIDEYAKNPAHDSLVLAHMKMQQQYANTVDDSANKKASELLAAAAKDKS